MYTSRMETGERLKNLLCKIQSKEKFKKPCLIFDDGAIEVIRKVHGIDNPNLHEIPFLGVVGEDDRVENIICEPNFARHSRLHQTGIATFTSSVDKNELTHLFQKALSSGKLEKVKMVGHLHPSGETIQGQHRVIIPPSEDLLLPSKSDISFMDVLGELNPNQNIDYTAITANTPDGPKLRVYDTKKLVKMKKVRDLDDLPSQTIDLY